MEPSVYQTEYNNFLASYKIGSTSGEDVGHVIAKMAQYFTEANMNYGKALIAYNIIASQIEQQTDDNGKAISSTKAKAIASASQESQILILAKIHLENIEQKINALKALQKGILNEYAHVGNM